MQILLTLNGPVLIRSRYFAKFQTGALLNASYCNSSPLWQDPKLCLPIFYAFIKFDIRNGEQAIFWENRWADGLVLKYSMPDLYKLALDKKFIVARMLSKHRRNELNFFRPIDRIPMFLMLTMYFFKYLILTLSWIIWC